MNRILAIFAGCFAAAAMTIAASTEFRFQRTPVESVPTDTPVATPRSPRLFELGRPRPAPAATSSVDLHLMEKEMWRLVNEDRRNPQYEAETHGHAAGLVWDDALAQVARAHSADMGVRGFFAHQNPDGLRPASRVTAAGIRWKRVAENIALYDQVEAAQAAFMAEPPSEPNHRANILDPKLTHIGIGIARTSTGQLLITQDFATPAP